MLLLTIYCILWIINIFCALTSLKNNRLITFLTWGVLFIAFATNIGSDGDALLYRRNYEYDLYLRNWPEKGNVLVAYICKSFGLSSYNEYLTVLFILGSTLIYSGLRKMQANFHVFFAVIMGFIFPALATAIRFFMAFAIFVYALPFLYKKRYVHYFFLCLIQV